MRIFVSAEGREKIFERCNGQILGGATRFIKVHASAGRGRARAAGTKAYDLRVFPAKKLANATSCRGAREGSLKKRR